MAVELGTGYVQLIPSARGFQSAIEKELGPDLDKAGHDMGDKTSKNFGASFSSGLKTVAKAAAIGFGVAFAGAAVLGKSAIDAASDLAETQSKVNTVFGESAGLINDFAKNAARGMGQSEQQALDAASTFGNLFVQLGLGSDQAANMSTQMVSLASDFASFHNANPEDVIIAQTAAFRGEYDALQRFVPTINAAAVEQKAMAMGLADANGELDAQDKALAVQALMMEGAGDAMGDFARTSDGAANQQRILSAEWKDAQASLGQGLLPIFTKVVSFLADKLPGAIDWAKKAFAELSAQIQDNWPKVRDVLVGAFDAIRGAIQWLLDHRPVLIGVLTAIGVGLTAWAVAAAAAGVASAAAWIAAAAPFILVGAAIAGLVAGVITLYEKVDWFRAFVDTVADGLVAAWQGVVEGWQRYADDIGRVLDEIWQKVQTVWDDILAVVRTTVDVIGEIISTGVDVWKKAWVPIELLLKVAKELVFDPIVFQFKLMFTVVETAIKVGVGAFKTAWNVIEALYTFFRDSVYNPIVGLFNGLRGVIEGAINGAVTGAKTAWNAILGVYLFFRDQVYQPIEKLWGQIRDRIGGAFDAAVDAVKTAWDKLKDIVKTPINAVIGFYNVGIRGVWNGVISKIPGVGTIPEVQKLAKGGQVPGSGNGDTVPAMLTPGEFVITKKAAKGWGPRVLDYLNRGPSGTVDPAVFGYAAGGFVRSMDEAKEWARQQAGKPYTFPLVGPNAYDCSGLTSALLNYIEGKTLNRRRHSSGSIGSDPAVAPGIGDPANGLSFGAKGPNVRNSVGALVGHIVATLGGMNVEATPPAVRVGPGARGASDGSLPNKFHVPGFGGLSDEDKGIVSLVKSLRDMILPDLGGPPMGDLLQKLFSDLPGRIFDFLMKKLPSVIIEGVKDAVGGLFKLVTPFVNGGGVRRSGPILVGEERPELVWGSRGEYIQSEIGSGGGLTLNVQGSILGDEQFRRYVREEAASAEFHRRTPGWAA